MADKYRFGIEEEYFLADAQTLAAPPVEVLDRFHAETAGHEAAEHELLKGQVETSTEPGDSFDEAQATLRAVRRELSAIAKRHRLLLFAAGSHPTAQAKDQHVSTTKRYKRLGDELRLIAPRAAVSAMHVHVEVPDPARRIDLINRLTPYLPLLHALSVSSPFWEGRNTGLRGYRLSAFAQWPRTGLPELFADATEYDRLVARLTSAGFIEDASVLWWHIRPSVHYPTIEMRICDSCTKLDDALAIAALYRCLVRAVDREPDRNAGFGPVERGLCRINLWRAQQLGVAATFADTSADRVVTVGQILAELLRSIEEHADSLQVGPWLEKLSPIVEEGASADRQLRIYESASGDDKDMDDAALGAVVESLAAGTIM